MFEQSTPTASVNMGSSVPRITRSVLKAIELTIGSMPAETGGLLAARRDGVIDFFHFDAAASTSRVTYTPATETFSGFLRALYDSGRLNCGMVHSHPPGFLQLSGGDVLMAEKYFAHNPRLAVLYFPIVQTKPDTGEFELIFYQIDRPRKNERIRPTRVPYQIVEEEEVQADTENTKSTAVEESRWASNEDPFARIRSCVDVERMQRSHVVVIGFGGSAQTVVKLARQGVGHFTLVDPDHVTVPNLATQGYTRRDLGRPKVIALADQIRDVSPQARVRPIVKRSEDINDAQFGAILKGYTPTVLAAFTDSFPAQAAIARLALKFAVPFIAAQVWPRGYAAEIVYTYPGVTGACHRCVLRKRYDAQQRDPFDAESVGSPISTTSLVSACCTLLFLGLLHAGTDHPRFGRMIDDLGNRNLFQIKADSSFREQLFTPSMFAFPEVFDWAGVGAVAMPSHEDCHDCRGEGSGNEPADWIGESQIIFADTHPRV